MFSWSKVHQTTLNRVFNQKYPIYRCEYSQGIEVLTAYAGVVKGKLGINRWALFFGRKIQKVFSQSPDDEEIDFMSRFPSFEVKKEVEKFMENWLFRKTASKSSDLPHKRDLGNLWNKFRFDKSYYDILMSSDNNIEDLIETYNNRLNKINLDFKFKNTLADFRQELVREMRKIPFTDPRMGLILSRFDQLFGDVAQMAKKNIRLSGPKNIPMNIWTSKAKPTLKVVQKNFVPTQVRKIHIETPFGNFEGFLGESKIKPSMWILYLNRNQIFPLGTGYEFGRGTFPQGLESKVRKRIKEVIKKNLRGKTASKSKLFPIADMLLRRLARFDFPEATENIRKHAREFDKLSQEAFDELERFAERNQIYQSYTRDAEYLFDSVIPEILKSLSYSPKQTLGKMATKAWRQLQQLEKMVLKAQRMKKASKKSYLVIKYRKKGPDTRAHRVLKPKSRWELSERKEAEKELKKLKKDPNIKEAFIEEQTPKGKSASNPSAAKLIESINKFRRFLENQREMKKWTQRANMDIRDIEN